MLGIVVKFEVLFGFMIMVLQDIICIVKVDMFNVIVFMNFDVLGMFVIVVEWVVF